MALLGVIEAVLVAAVAEIEEVVVASEEAVEVAEAALEVDLTTVLKVPTKAILYPSRDQNKDSEP